MVQFSGVTSFVCVITCYDDLCDKAFQEGIIINQQWVDEIFRHLGWLGERLFSKQDIEDEPLMTDDFVYPVHNRFLDILLSYSQKYDNKYPDSRPLLYFDAISVVLSRLLTIHKQKKVPTVENSILGSVGAYSSFAKSAASAGNDNGVALAVVRLEEAYKESVQSQLDDIAKYAIAELTTVAAHVVVNRSRLSGQSFLGQPIDEYIINILQKSDFREAIAQEIKEVYMKQWSDHKAIWDLITRLGKQMETNFGFMFDWQTGELYSDKDPRRR